MSQPNYGASAEKFGMPPSESQSPPRRSGCVKVLIVLLVLGVLAVLLCCGGVFFMSTRLASTDEGKVRTLSSDIITMEISEKWKPALSLEMFPWVFKFARVVIYTLEGAETEGKYGLLVVADSSYGRDVIDQMRNSLQAEIEKNHDEAETLRVIESGDRTFTVRGNPVSFRFDRCEGERTKTSYWKVDGQVDGNTNPTVIVLIAPADVVNEDDIRQMIESIK
jgi:hypothetical protein